MTITLREMADAVTTYFNTLIVCSVAITPTQGANINPGETFKVTLSVTNADSTQGVRITNVRYHVKVSSPAKALIDVPPETTGIARSGPLLTSPIISEPRVGEMYIFPPSGRWVAINYSLEPGETDSMTLDGRALLPGTPNVIFSIIGDVQLPLLNQSSSEFSQALPIIYID